MKFIFQILNIFGHFYSKDLSKWPRVKFAKLCAILNCGSCVPVIVVVRLGKKKKTPIEGLVPDKPLFQSSLHPFIKAVDGWSCKLALTEQCFMCKERFFFTWITNIEPIYFGGSLHQ